MRFTLRPGTDPSAVADRTMLTALGLPGGGVVRCGETHVAVKPGDTPSPTVLLIGPQTLANSGSAYGSSVDIQRALLGPATLVRLDAEDLPAPAPRLMDALGGRPVTIGDTVTIDRVHLPDSSESATMRVLGVEPGPAARIGPTTRFARRDEHIDARLPGGIRAEDPVAAATSAKVGVTREEALLAGLEVELETLTGWLRLLAGPGDLPAAWGLPAVAGVILEAPPGCGGPELTARAAAAAGVHLHEISLDLVFKPARLLDLLEQAVKNTPRPSVIHVDRIESVAGSEAMAPFKSQVAAIFRWFLDSVADAPGLAVVLGVTSASAVDASLAESALLPRVLRIPPPDTKRRALLFESALGRVPTDDIDYDHLASRSPGFSGADILAAVIHATAKGLDNGPLTTEDVSEAVADTRPSLGAISLGEIPSYGFDKVANLVHVKERLTESVIWPMTRPDTFRRLGIEPPKGMLLHGPPGTGKTFVIRALANEAGAAFFPVKGAELLDKFVGESERAVRDTFSRARAAAPSILFFDELDALAPVRGSSTNNVTDSVVAALLTELDGIGGRGEVFVIGATNRKDLIDPALLRAGRFEVHLELGFPEKEARRALLDIVDIPFDETVDLDVLAASTEGLSFADITGLLREAALQALRRDEHALDVGRTELDAALEHYRNR